MPRPADSKEDRSTSVAPFPSATAPWRVVEAFAQEGARLHVRFVDGTEGGVHLKAFLESDQTTGTVFEALRDPEVFAEVDVQLGAVCWPNGADLAPDAMYDAIRLNGYWVLSAT